MTTESEQTAPELLPCPFCGEQFAVRVANTGISWVVCGVCDTEGPPKDTDSEAIAAWNRRAPPASGSLDAKIAEMSKTPDPSFKAKVREFVKDVRIPAPGDGAEADDAATLRRIADDELGGENNATVYAIATRLSSLLAENARLTKEAATAKSMADNYKWGWECVVEARVVCVALARREEREACAKVADLYSAGYEAQIREATITYLLKARNETAVRIAAAIRAMGE